MPRLFESRALLALLAVSILLGVALGLVQVAVPTAAGAGARARLRARCSPPLPSGACSARSGTEAGLAHAVIDRYLVAVFLLGVLLAPVGLAASPGPRALLLVAGFASALRPCPVRDPGRLAPGSGPRRSPAGRSVAGALYDSRRPAGSTIPLQDEVQRRFPRLQGLARRRARDPRAAARRRARRGARRHTARRRRDQHLLRDERGGCEEPQGRRPGGPDARPRVRDRVWREPRAGCVRRLPPNVVVVPKRAEETAAFVAGDVGAIGCVQADARLDRVRAFVKIQDGCSFSCGFCVIPLVRGASRSRSAEAVLAEIRRRVEQGHREIVLTGINLGCFRDRAPASTCRGSCARQATPGLDRLRLSSIEINHVSDELVAALRETPTVAKHLHVPLQSGDDEVLRAMRRRYSTATYLRRLEGLAGEFNLTSDVIVGFPAEDERAFERTLRTVEAAGLTKVHVFPYSPTPGNGDRRRRPGVAAGQEGAQRAPAGALARARAASLAGEARRARPRARRPARPRLRRRLLAVPRRRAGRRARSRARPGRQRGGHPLPSQHDDCLFCQIVRDGSYVAKTKGFVAINDINPQAPVHLLIIPERHVDTFREIGEFPARETKRMLEFVAETARGAGLSDYRVVVNVGPKPARPSSICTGTSSAAGCRAQELAAELASTAVTEL